MPATAKNKRGARRKRGGGKGSVWKPSRDQREAIRSMAAYGFTRTQIAKVYGISEDTLYRHHKEDIDTAAHRANAQVAETLFRMAVSGENIAATIFWLKTRARWRETDRLEVTDPVGKPLGSDAVAQLVARIDLIAERKAALAEGGIIEGSAVVEGEGGSDSGARR